MSAMRPAFRSPKRRPKRIQVLEAILLAALGFGLAVSVRANSQPARLATARPDDLVRILGDLDSRAQRLRTQIGELQQTRDRLSGAGSAGAAVEETRRRVDELSILAGTVPAQGPGVVVTVTDPGHQVRADVLVDAVEELRDAGAEAIDISGVRLGVDSWIVDDPAGINVDGHELRAPYVFTALGDPPTLAKALQIPGGVVDTVAAQPAASAAVRSDPHLVIRSLRTPHTDQYAHPTAH